MAVTDIHEYLQLIGPVRNSPQQYLWSSYDREADTLYITFKKPSRATDSELTDDDVTMRMASLPPCETPLAIDWRADGLSLR